MAVGADDNGVSRKDSENIRSSERLVSESGQRNIDGKEVTIVTNDIEITEDRSVQSGEVGSNLRRSILCNMLMVAYMKINRDGARPLRLTLLSFAEHEEEAGDTGTPQAGALDPDRFVLRE